MLQSPQLCLFLNVLSVESQSVLLCVWLPSFNLIFMRVMYVAYQQFFHLYYSVAFHSMNRPQTLPLLIYIVFRFCGEMGGIFYNILLKVFLQTYVSFLWGKHLGVHLLDPQVGCVQFYKKTIFSKCLYHFTLPSVICENCSCSISLPTFGIVSHFNFSHSHGHEMGSHVVVVGFLKILFR